MTHSFQYNAHNLLELFEGTTKFSGRGGWKSKMEAWCLARRVGGFGYWMTWGRSGN